MQIDETSDGCQLADGQTVRLTVRLLVDTVPPAVRLRKMLKCLQRSFGLRCEAVEMVPTEKANESS